MQVHGHQRNSGSVPGGFKRMEPGIRTIDRDELKAKLDRGDDFKLVMAMHEWGFNAAHIPGRFTSTQWLMLRSTSTGTMRSLCIAATLHAWQASLPIGG